jgi:CheY-like chemotaxis protein
MRSKGDAAEGTNGGAVFYRAPSILLVEDDAAFRDLVAEQLREAGYDVIETRNGGELLEYVERHLAPGARGRRPDLIVSDVRMRGLSGFDLTGGLKLAGYGIPVIFITAFGSDAVQEHTGELGVVAVLDMPFELDELMRTVVDALE